MRVIQMDINTLRIIITVASLTLFLAIVAWALWPSNRAGFDAAAAIPLADDSAEV